ncbi:cytoskeleton-associated protein 2-like [Danio aesculapii]|uniref:cytoskeleton-associated protein 2-like n=1 Tax=Danio aesculapii TaxID=1142201 RepID=UPI0024BF4AAF|nr:cytoskeleton-associated protein 2-like [Danio aesculapii]
METVTGEDVTFSKLSKIELRKLKLAEYLAAKGRLKVPNPKPYLKGKPVTNKPAENNQKIKITGDEKENCGISAVNAKGVTRVKTLADVDKNTSLKKGLNIHSLAKAPAQFSSKPCNTHQAGFHALRTKNNGTASFQNPRQLLKAEKTCTTRTHPQSLQNAQNKAQPASHVANKSQKSSLVSVCGSSHSVYIKSSVKCADQAYDSKMEQKSARLLGKKLTETTIKTTTTATLKSRGLLNTTGTKIQTNNISKKQTLQPRCQSGVPKYGTHSRNPALITWKSNSATNRSGINQKKDVSCIITKATKIQSHNPVTNRETRTSVSNTQAKPVQQPRSQNVVPVSSQRINQKSNSATNRSDINQRKGISCITTKVDGKKASVSSKPVNLKGSANIKTQQHATLNANNATASTKLPGRNTRSCVLTQTTSELKELQQPVMISNQIKPAVQFQTPKSSICPSNQGVRTAPADGKKRLTEAQEERLRKLQEWRESRGITYKRPPMPVRLVRRKTVSTIPQPYWTSMENEDEVQDIVFAVERSLDDCIQLLQQGFPVEQVRDVMSRVPMAQKFAKYWICQARLMEREGNLEVLSLFEEAIRVVREPVDELRAVIFEILKKKQSQGQSPVSKESEEAETTVDDEHEDGDLMCTPKPVGALICGVRGDSSVVKYKITATPGGKRSQQGAEPGQVDGHEIRFFTPVRRSVRIEKTARRYPTALQEHDPCVTSMCDLAGESKEEVHGDPQPQNSPLYVYRENEALRDCVQVKLVYPEEVES